MDQLLTETLRHDAWLYTKKPAPALSLYDRVSDALRAEPGLEAIRFRKLKLSNQNLLEQIEAWRSILHRLGLRKGDVITLVLPNIPHFPVIFYAANAQGIIVHPVHPLTVTKELERNMEQTGSKTVFLFAPLVPRHRELLEDSGYQVILCEARDYLVGIERFLTGFKPSPKLRDAHFYARLAKESLPAPDLPPMDPHEPAVYLSSGGTTGRAKIIELSSQNFNALGEQAPAFMGTADLRGLKMLAMLPFFHGFGLCMQLHTMLINGMTSILVPKFSAEAMAEILRDDKPELLCAVPTVYEALLQMDDVGDLSYLVAAFCGGDHLRPELKQKMDQYFRNHGAGITLREGYGLTETVTAIAVNPREDDRSGTVGKPIPYHEFSIPEPDEKGVGELYVTGPTVMIGYLNDEATTREIIVEDAEGRRWVKTGDLASFEDGYLKLHGRLKRLIKVSGISVFPIEIEALLEQVAGVAQVTCYAVPHPYKQQEVEAAIVPEQEHQDWDALVEKLQAYAKENLMHHARPVRYRHYEELPKTAIGKIDVTTLETWAQES